MSTKANATGETEENNDWHTLPAMIGDAITATEPTFLASGGYLVERTAGEDIIIYREVDVAESLDQLDDHGDRVFEFYDYVQSGAEIATIPAPAEGWDGETESLPADIFGGFR